MASAHDNPQSGALEGEPVRELRRTYHDRIAGIREESVVLLRAAVESTAAAARVLHAPAGEPVPSSPVDVPAMRERAAAVDQEVVGLLALESPVARDLRVILAARDVTQIGMLCLGLCATLADRAGRAAAMLHGDLCRTAGDVASGTERLLRDAEAAWAMLDLDTATSVIPAAAEARAAQDRLIAGLIALGGVAMEDAFDLALVARAFERLADHGVEIAERVVFAVQGTTPPVSPT